VRNTFFKVRVIGDFPAKEAREFFDTLTKGTVSDADWLRVSAVSSKRSLRRR